jgi:RNA polymerase sigma factor (sigma-70 family)
LIQRRRFSARIICEPGLFVGESGKVSSEARYILMDNDASSLHTRPSLLVRIRDPQDAVSWRSFVELYTPPVLRYCRLRGLQDADAADVTQEVMAQVARSMRSFRYAPERGRFRDWLGTITRRKVNRHLTKRNLGTAGLGGDNTPEATLDPRTIEADAEWSTEFNAQILRAALDRVRPSFGPATWNAFASVWLEDRTAADTARALGVSLEAVYVAKSKVLKRLEQEVLELAEDFPLADTNR